MNRFSLRSIEGRREYLRERSAKLNRLYASGKRLETTRVQECMDEIIKSYEKSTIINEIAGLYKENNIEDYRFRSIGLYHKIDKQNFLASDYIWGPYFSDVGRAIARGEEKYLHRRIGRYVTGIGKSISYSNPDFDLLTEGISILLERGTTPNIIFAPIQLFSKFTKHFYPQTEWVTDGPAQLRIRGCTLNIYWFHKYAPLRSFVIFNSSAGVWHTLKDQNTEKSITVAIAESEKNPKYIVYYVETLAYYRITNKDAYVRINMSP